MLLQKEPTIHSGKSHILKGEGEQVEEYKQRNKEIRQRIIVKERRDARNAYEKGRKTLKEK